MPICLDASVAIKLVAPEEDSLLASALVAGIVKSGEGLIAPALWDFEVCNALWQKARTGLLTAEGAHEAIDELRRLPMTTLIDGLLIHRALALAVELGLPSAYDGAYLAAAEMQNCPFLTADRRLAEAAAAWRGEVRLLGRDLPADA